MFKEMNNRKRDLEWAKITSLRISLAACFYCHLQQILIGDYGYVKFNERKLKAQSSFIPKLLVEFCRKIRRAHTVLASSEMQEA